MIKTIVCLITGEISRQIQILFAEYESTIKHQQDSIISEIKYSSERLDNALTKIDIMIARSDARVDAINHMVDNCLELSRICSSATEEANKTVSVNCNTISEEISLHKQITKDQSSNISELHYHISILETLLDAERKERLSLHDAVSSIKQTIDMLIGSSARPNININQQK